MTNSPFRMQNTKEIFIFNEVHYACVPMSGLVDDAKDAGDKMKAGAKASWKENRRPKS